MGAMDQHHAPPLLPDQELDHSIAAFADGRDAETRKGAHRRLRSFESDVCTRVGIPDGTVLVSCPPARMLFKKLGAWVRIDQDIFRLQELPTDPVSSDVRQLEASHESLWRFYVFVDPEYLESHGAVIADALNLMLPRRRLQNSIRRWPARQGQAIVNAYVSNHSDAEILALEAVALTEKLANLSARHGGSFESILDAGLAELRSVTPAGAPTNEAAQSSRQTGSELDVWRKQFSWIEHNNLEATLKSRKLMDALRAEFQEQALDANDITAVNLLLHLKEMPGWSNGDTSTAVGVIVGRTDLLEKELQQPAQLEQFRDLDDQGVSNALQTAVEQCIRVVMKQLGR